MSMPRSGQLAVVTHHLIRFSRDALRGTAEASFYADPSRADGSPAYADGPISAMQQSAPALL